MTTEATATPATSEAWREGLSPREQAAVEEHANKVADAVLRPGGEQCADDWLRANAAELGRLTSAQRESLRADIAAAVVQHPAMREPVVVGEATALARAIRELPPGTSYELPRRQVISRSLTRPGAGAPAEASPELIVCDAVPSRHSVRREARFIKDENGLIVGKTETETHDTAPQR